MYTLCLFTGKSHNAINMNKLITIMLIVQANIRIANVRFF